MCIRDRQDAEAIAKHFVAVSTALDLVADFGIDPENAFGFWNWGGGRYAVDSAVGLSLIIALGPERFQQFLAGFRAIAPIISAAAIPRPSEIPPATKTGTFLISGSTFVIKAIVVC